MIRRSFLRRMAYAAMAGMLGALSWPHLKRCPTCGKRDRGVDAGMIECWPCWVLSSAKAYEKFWASYTQRYREL